MKWNVPCVNWIKRVKSTEKKTVKMRKVALLKTSIVAKHKRKVAIKRAIQTGS